MFGDLKYHPSGEAHTHPDRYLIIRYKLADVIKKPKQIKS
jgi:hypothetical protein